MIATLSMRIRAFGFEGREAAASPPGPHRTYETSYNAPMAFGAQGLCASICIDWQA
jgi:hypothetical protein